MPASDFSDDFSRERLPPKGLPTHILQCVVTAQDRCKAMRFAMNAFAGLETLLILAQRAEPRESPADRVNIAALLRLITDEAQHRLEEAIMALDEIGEEVAIRRERG